MRRQHGFTLLELMVAMAIFAMLAVAGWQVFDSVTRARERAQFHADNLAVLQYAYLQLQQDMGQIISYQAPGNQGVSNSGGSNNSSNNTNGDSNNSSKNDTNSNNPIAAEPFMRLDSEQVGFVRFADPDPRYQSSNSIQRVEYIFTDQRLIRRQYSSIQGGRDSVSLDSVLLEGVTAGRWQAYLPELSSKFPNTDSTNNNINSAAGQTDNIAADKSETILLPKGISVNFTYQDMPITWQWALTPQPLPNSSAVNNNNNAANNNSNGNDDNTNNPDNPNSANNSNSANNNNDERSNNNTGNKF